MSKFLYDTNDNDAKAIPIPRLFSKNSQAITNPQNQHFLLFPYVFLFSIIHKQVSVFKSHNSFLLQEF